MIEQNVEFETAKIAKQKGFDWKTEYFFDYDGEGYSMNFPQANIFDFDTTKVLDYAKQKENWNKFDFDEERILGFRWDNGIIFEYFTICCSCPTQSLLQKWLREEYKINIDIITHGYQIIYYELNITKPNKVKLTYFCDESLQGAHHVIPYKFDTYEEALEEGLQQALKLL